MMPILTTTVDPDSARAFLKEAPLPAARGRGVQRGAAVPPQAQYSTDSAQALAVGSHVTEFAADVPPALRADITNSFLLAQLAANSFLHAVGGGSKEWYDRFVYVLVNSGWDIQTAPDQVVEVSSGAGEVYQEMIPILRKALGAAADSSILMGTLRALATIPPDRAWITLFERESQRAQANQFQISYVDAPGGKPRVSLTSFELDASQSVTRVLFFRFSEVRATLRYSTPILTINQPVFDRVRDVVEERIRDQLGSFIAGIDL
jgi:hypothetical protein